MSNSIQSRVNQLLEALWSETKVWPEYAASLQQVLISGFIDDGLEGPGPSRWFTLPQLCCQAAGGDPVLADPVTAAWLLFQLAADIMDAVEDGDSPEGWWAEKGSGYALNIASGLYFTASLALNTLYQKNQFNFLEASEIVTETYQSFLRMSCGQHLDLTTPEPTLEQCWKIAASKSGEFFAVGCRTGARLATRNSEMLAEYEQFGYHLGLLIQILDDLDEVEALSQPLQFEKQGSLFRSIAIAYSLDVLPINKRERLRGFLRGYPKQQEDAQAARELILGSGVGLYLRFELERHRTLALSALEGAQPAPWVKELLISMLDKLTT